MKRLVKLKDYYEQPDLPLDVEYNIGVVHTSYNSVKDSVQLAVSVENEELDKRGILFEEFLVDSKAFEELISQIYVVETDCIIEVDTERFDWFFGTGFLKEENGALAVDWDRFRADSTPVSGMRTYYREHDSEKYW